MQWLSEQDRGQTLVIPNYRGSLNYCSSLMKQLKYRDIISMLGSVLLRLSFHGDGFLYVAQAAEQLVGSAERSLMAVLR